MRILNNYSSGYTKLNNETEIKKYGLLNEFGYNIDCSVKENYNPDKIIKSTCNPKNDIKKK